MKSASHQAMGYLLCRALERRGISLDREMFVLGNLLPDYLPELILAPHFTMKCQREINVFTGVLATQRLGKPSQVPAQYSLRLGILCHYITDYFCFAHTREFKQNIIRHTAYEQELDDYFRAHYTERESLMPGLHSLNAGNARECAQEIFRIKRLYKSTVRKHETDVRFAFTVCLLSVQKLLLLSARPQQSFCAASRFSPFTAEKYAFKPVLCRRRIVPKNAWCPLLPAA
ncbi:MAG TPA: zinc dependent phospholipase C family protein [Eubacteriales bacterium]|nr:zinc dependent phospholipase C family protein [Eubacteriales bacterium]